MSEPKGNALDLIGGPAFPISIPGFGDNGCAGMSLRDWFAGQAMAVLSMCDVDDPKLAAQRSYAMADAMIEAKHSPAKTE